MHLVVDDEIRNFLHATMPYLIFFNIYCFLCWLLRVQGTMSMAYNSKNVFQRRVALISPVLLFLFVFFMLAFQLIYKRALFN